MKSKAATQSLVKTDTANGEGLAISYLRYSSRKQINSDSYRRQSETTDRYCKEHGLKLIDRLEDLGISGWDKSNLDDAAALGGFLNEVRAGKVPKQTCLICENLDRLSRAEILDAFDVIKNILKAGIDIVTTMDGKRYSYASVSANPMELIIAITILARGNEESNTKSKRVREAWNKKLKNIHNGTFAKHACPQWLTHDGTKYVVIKAKAEVVRLIFKLYNSGRGVVSVIKELGRRDIKPFGRSAAWQPMTIHRMITGKAVLGYNDFVEPPVKGYYPTVVSEDIYYKAQKQRENNHKDRGRKRENFINVFTGVCKCHLCGASMNRYYVNGKDDKSYVYLRCLNSKLKNCNSRMIQLSKLEQTFIAIVSMANFSKILFDDEQPFEDKREEIQGKIFDVNKTINRVSDAIVKTDSPALVERLTNLELERRALEKDYEKAITDTLTKGDVRAEYKDIVTNIKSEINNNEFRVKLRSLIRKHIFKIVAGRSEYKVCFKDSADTIRVFLNKDTFEISYWDEVEEYKYADFVKN